MAKITLRGKPLHTNGELPQVGTPAPDFTGVKADLSDVRLSDFKGKKVVLNIFPSLDTAVCAASVRRFNKEVSGLDNTVVLCISKDLPFAQTRFCTTEGLTNVIPLSQFRCDCFEKNYGILITDGPMRGLLARAVVVVDEKGETVYTQLVDEITNEPDYGKAISAVKE